MRYFKKYDNRVAAFDDDQMTGQELKEKILIAELALRRIGKDTDSYRLAKEELKQLKATKIWIGDDLVEMTSDEVNAYLNPPSSNEQLAASVRSHRDLLLDDVSKRYDRYASEKRLGLETTDSIGTLDIYAQSLRDITKQKGFPEIIEWPELPISS